MSLFEIVPEEIGPIQILPQEILSFLLSFLSEKQDRANCKNVSRAFRRGIRESCKSLRIILWDNFYLFKSENISLENLSKFVNLEKLDIQFGEKRVEKYDPFGKTVFSIQNVPILSRLKTLKTEIELDCSKFPMLEKLFLRMESVKYDEMGLSNISKLKRLNMKFPFRDLDSIFPNLKLIEKLEFNDFSNQRASKKSYFIPFSEKIKILHFDVSFVPLLFDKETPPKETLEEMKSFSIATWDYHIKKSNFGDFFSNKKELESICFHEEGETDIGTDGFEKNGRLNFGQELAERLPKLKKLQVPLFNFTPEKHGGNIPLSSDKYLALDYFRKLEILSLYNVGDANIGSQLKYLPLLRKFCSGSNYFYEDSFENALNLEVLIVSACNFTDNHFQNGKFPKLKVLHFVDWNFPFDDSDGLNVSNEMFSNRNFPNLKYFFLYGSNISDLNNLLDKCPKLKGLSVINNYRILNHKSRINLENCNSKLKCLIVGDNDHQVGIPSPFLLKISTTIEYLSIHIDDIHFFSTDLLKCDKLKGINIVKPFYKKEYEILTCKTPMDEPYMRDIFQEKKKIKKKKEPFSRKELENIVLQIDKFQGKIEEIDENKEKQEKERDEKRKLDWEEKEEEKEEEQDEEENDNRKKQKK